jgi:ectoine hydroxylase-related dioxygenase (phytanoyl-CoA dioxygenase family)
VSENHPISYFRQHGYVVIDDALAGFDLSAVRAAYNSVLPRDVIDGRYQGGLEPTVQATSVILSGTDAATAGYSTYDTIFLEIANNRRIIRLIREIVGTNFQSMEILAHCHQAHTNAHTGWHRDWSPWTHPLHSLKVKVFYLLDDQDESMGPLSLVPGSHKRPDPPPLEYSSGSNLRAMPGMKAMTGRAGTAVVWDALCWHTALPNISNRDRRIIVYGYMPFWVKKWNSHPPPDHIVRWCDTPEKRQLMGIHAAVGRQSWDRDDVPYLPGYHRDAVANREREHLGDRTDLERRLQYRGDLGFEEVRG